MKQNYRVNIKHNEIQKGLLQTLQAFSVIKTVSFGLTNNYQAIHVLGRFDIAEYEFETAYYITIETHENKK